MAYGEYRLQFLHISEKVEAKLQAQELKRLADANDFQTIAELRGLWLPGVHGAEDSYLHSAKLAATLWLRRLPSTRIISCSISNASPHNRT